MNSCRSDAVGAVNSYLAQLRSAAATSSAKVTLVLFDSQGIDTIRAGVTAAVCPDVVDEEYVPRGNTPLFDAVGRTVTQLEAAGPPDELRMLAIMTDGLENASKEYTADVIAALLVSKQEQGWTVVYLGADHDAWPSARRLGIRASATSQFDKHNISMAMLQMASVTTRAASGESNIRFTAEERRKLNSKRDEDRKD